MNKDIITMSDLETKEIHWLWYPYIPYGKVTIIQGDPGEGKTTLSLAIAALLTRGLPMPESDEPVDSQVVIYQTAEDGLADTVKPRLEAVGADLTKVMVINEGEIPLTLADKRIYRYICETKAKLMIIDPLQAYLGAGVDMHRANEVRPIFKALAEDAESTGCAIVIIGHMNKTIGSKGMYRGLGSIDIGAAVRSILLVGRDKENPNTRVMIPIKSNLAPEGVPIAFELGENGFRWIGKYEIDVNDILNGTSSERDTVKLNLAVSLLIDMLQKEEVPATEVYARLEKHGIGKRTVERAKKIAGVRSKQKGSHWIMTLS